MLDPRIGRLRAVLVPVLFLLAGLAVGALGLRPWMSERPVIATEPKPAPSVVQSAEVILPKAKQEAARLIISEVETDALPQEVVVPGRIEANADRRLEIRPRVPGVVRSVAVVLGQRVRAGDLLLTLDSADVATARLGLRARQRELITTKVESEWRDQVAANVEELIPELRGGEHSETLEQRFADKPLGTDRSLLLSAYADWQIAVHEEGKQADLLKRQIVAEHVAELARHTRESAQAKFEAALEQVRYDAQRQRRMAELQVKLAESAVTDAALRLKILGVPIDAAELGRLPSETIEESAGADQLTECPIVAPFDGTIIQRAAVASQRVEPSEVMLTIANLETVRVVASIPESDFAILPSLRTQTVRVSSAAYPGQELRAKLLDVSAQVDPATRSVTLLAELPNPDGLLKLGMFVKVALDGAAADSVVVVPVDAVVEIDGQSTVFVSRGDGESFVARPVTIGREVEGRRAVLTGLKAGDRVVTSGAFALKSELILQNETEEE